MKRFLFIFMAIMFFALQGWSQTTLNESFEGATFPPEDWTIQTTYGGGSWESSTTIAHSGIKSARSGYYSGGCIRWLITPKLSVTSDSTNFAFWIATNYWYGGGDTIQVFISTTNNQTSSFSTPPLLSFNDDSVSTTWAQHSVDLSDYIGQDIYIAIKVIDNYGFNTFIDDITGPNLFVPSCPKPRNLTISTITTTNAELGWSDATGSLWNVQYLPANDTNWSNATNITGITSNPYNIQGLNNSTEYKVRVQRDCLIEQSEWSTPISFRTQCGAISLPWTEGFENSWNPTITAISPSNSDHPFCWININNGYNSYYKWSRSTSNIDIHTGSGSAVMYGGYSSSSTYTNSDWLISPIFTLTGNERLNFYTKSESASYPEDISIYILDVTTNVDITSTADTSHFVRIMGPEIQTTSWLFHEIPLTYQGNYRIAFVRNSLPGGQFLCLDDISISEMPACPNTYNLTSTLRSATEVDLNWMENGNGSGWIIAYGNTSTFDPSTATQTINVSSTDAVPYTVTNLTPQTSYSFAVRQNCPDGAWSNIISVTTPATAATLPYFNDFEDITENNSWTFINGTQANKWFIGTAADTLGITGLYISNDYGVNNQYTGGSAGLSKVYAYRDFEVPVGGGELELSFDWRAKGGVAHSDFLRFYLIPLDANITAGVNPPNGLDASAQIGNYTGGTGEYWLSQSTVWQHQTMRINSLQFPNLAGRTWRLLVCWRNESSDTSSNIQPPAAIDNINLAVVLCPRPSVLSASNITTTSALLTWNENGSATDWIIEYKPSSSTTWTEYQTSNNPDSITGLIPGISYSVRLRSVCSDEEASLYSNTITFQTVCGAQTVPTPVEDFLTTVPPTTCWSKMQGLLPTTGTAILSTTTDGWIWNSIFSGIPENAKININGTSSCKHWLISPSIDLGDGTTPAQLEFDAFYTAYASANLASAGGTDDRFAVVISTDDGLTWNAANATIWSNATGATRVLDNIPNIPTRIILPLFDPSTSLPYTGNIKIGFYAESTVSNTYNDFHIDNFEVRYYTSCQRPTSLIASNVTSTSANISFTENGTATTWEYVITDGTITDPNNGTLISLTTNPLQLTELLPQTQYTVWLRAACSSENSIWSNPLVFFTEATPLTLPYACDFENTTENLAWRSLSNGINKWAIGTAAGNGNTTAGTQANYISKDNGLSYAMNYGYIYAYTYRDINFGTDTSSYSLSFDWKCQGYFNPYSNSLTAGLRVYLRDPSEVINTLGLPTNPDDNLGSFYNASTWQNAQLSIDNLSGIKRLFFVYFDSYNNYAPPAAIDNISLVQAACPRPSNLLTSNLTTTSSDISWVHSGADSYIVSYRVDTTSSTLIDEAAPIYPYTIQNLSAGTEYIVSVRAICGTDTTMYSTTLTFTTPCYDGAISSFPWTEGFENGLNCWQQIYVNGTLSWNNPSSYSSNLTQPHQGTKIANFAGITRTNITKLVSPLMDISSLSTPYLSYWYILQNWGVTDRDTLRVYSRPSQTSSWTLLSTFYALDTYEWKKDSIALPNPSATYQIAFEGIECSGHGVGLDEIEVYDNNSTPCLSPANITISAATITNTTADVSWTTGGTETSWQIRLGETGTSIDVTTTSYQLTELTQGTNYTVYVRANCGTSYSPWVSQTFTTTSVYQRPTVTTVQETGTTQTSTNLNGSYVQGTNPVLVNGFQWKLSSTSTWTTQPASTVTTTFTYPLSGLLANTQYDFRAYAETSLDTTYGSTLQFTTLANTPPTVTTTPVTNITTTTATFNGTTAQGTEPIQARGFEYKLNSTSSWTGAIDVTATGTSTITANATGLTPITQYDVRAYAQTASGRTYGNIENFTTLPLDVVLGEVMTQSVTNIDTTSAVLNGNLVSVGNALSNIEVGFVYSTTSNPILGVTNVLRVDVTYVEGMTTYSSPITELEHSTTYHVKAFVNNSAGEAYGDEVTFKTDSLRSGLNDIDANKFSVTIYPNPATSTTKLVVDGVEGEVKVILSDVQGRILNTNIIKAVNGKVEETIDVNNFAKGVYYVRIQNITTSRTQKLVVQ